MEMVRIDYTIFPGIWQYVRLHFSDFFHKYKGFPHKKPLTNPRKYAIIAESPRFGEKRGVAQVVARQFRVQIADSCSAIFQTAENP